jgi:hypothetical protein
MDAGSKPQRIQRRRTLGWRMPEGAVYVGRPGRWGNPYRVGETNPATYDEYTAADVVDLYRRSVKFWWPKEYAEEARQLLAGRDLVCWCPLVNEHGNRVPCHADVLLELANSGPVIPRRTS